MIGESSNRELPRIQRAHGVITLRDLAAAEPPIPQFPDPPPRHHDAESCKAFTPNGASRTASIAATAARHEVSAVK